MRLIITDREGWRREFELERGIAFIGSDPRSDIPLDAARGSGVSPRHVQLIGEGDSRRLVNLSDMALMIDGQALPVPPRGVAEAPAGSVLRVGDWKVELVGSGGPNAVRNNLPGSSHIGARLTLPTSTLVHDQPIDGRVLVKNAGEETAVQFRVEVAGWPAACVELTNPPMLFPGATKEMSIRLLHPGDAKLAAGEHELAVRVTAPFAYPGEAAVSTARIRVMPHFAHKLRVVHKEALL